MPSSILTVGPLKVSTETPRLTASGISHVGFTPKSIGSLDAWYDATQIVGIASGTSLPTWTDLSGNGFHLTQASNGSQPLYISGGQNGNPIVRFIAGNRAFVSESAYSVAQPRTVFVVSKSTDTAAQYNLLGGVAASNTIFVQVTTGQLSAFAGSTLAFPSTLSAAWNVLAFIFNGSTSTGYLNGSSVSTGGAVGASSNRSFVIGQSSGGNFAGADVGEVTSFSRALTITEVTQLMNYFGSRWSIAVT